MTSPDTRSRFQPKVKVLLVDDRHENLLALSALMRRDDVELLTATSGREALELLLVHDVALALFDVRMPEMNGFELAELVRGTERTRNVPIIFVTAGIEDQRHLFKGYEAGAVDFLLKPFEAHVLNSKADVFIQLHHQKQQLAQELQERTETLRLNEMFTAVLGHDLRNPLNAILLGVDQLIRKSDDEVVHQTASLMQTSGRRMLRMIEDMLDFARARLAGGIVVQRERTDLQAIVERVVQECRTALPDAHIQLTVEGGLTGQWDPDRLTQVAANLIGNAIQHGGPDEPVQVGLDGKATDAVVLRVASAGVISPDVLPFIFDPFRGSTQPGVGRGEGLGLGLYIVKQIIQAHGGTISIESGGKRTVFCVELPREAPQEPRST